MIKSMDILSQLSATLPPKQSNKEYLEKIENEINSSRIIRSASDDMKEKSKIKTKITNDDEFAKKLQSEEDQYLRKLKLQQEEDEKLARKLQTEENKYEIHAKNEKNLSETKKYEQKNTFVIEEDPDDKYCVVCMEYEKCAFFVPCAHRCCCAKCAYEILEFKKVCPLCWTKLEGVNA